MAFDNGFEKHVINGVRYSAYNVQGSTWMVKRYNDSEDDTSYVECLFSIDTKDELTAIKAAIRNESWA
jgi:hypothetical protein